MSKNGITIKHVLLAEAQLWRVHLPHAISPIEIWPFLNNVHQKLFRQEDAAEAVERRSHLQTCDYNMRVQSTLLMITDQQTAPLTTVNISINVG